MRDLTRVPSSQKNITLGQLACNFIKDHEKYNLIAQLLIKKNEKLDFDKKKKKIK